MALFGFKKKEEIEILDRGLVKTRESVFSRLTRAVAGKSKIDDDVLDNLEEVLVSSDVGVETTLRIIERVSKRVARDKYVGTAELNAILRDEIAALLELIPTLPGRLILVSNEVGWGIVPMHPVSRLFADEQGRLNQRVAAACDAVTLVAAGLPLKLKG